MSARDRLGCERPRSGAHAEQRLVERSHELAAVAEQERLDDGVPDGAGRLAGLAARAGRSFGFGYDRNGNLTSQANPNGTTAAWIYDRADRLAAVSHATGGVPFAAFDYARDASGLLTAA